MGAFLSIFKSKPKTPVGVVDRIKNIAFNNFRGILGTLIPFALLFVLFEQGEHHLTTTWVWIWMFVSFLLQPVNIPVTGLIPIFAFPMFCAYSTDKVCPCYFNEHIALFILGGWLLLLLNNSGFDRRLTLKILCGSSNVCSCISLIIRASAAAFILSMISNRLIVTANLMQYVTPTLISLQRYAKKGVDPDYDHVRSVVANAIHTSSAIGSIVIAHAAFGTLAFRAIFYGSSPEKTEYSDVFNYVHYTAFAFPTAIGMFVVNLLYNIVMTKIGGKPMSESNQMELKKALDKHKNALPKKVSLHEYLTVVSVLLSYGLYFGRWSTWFAGWGDQYKTLTNPHVKDATVSAMFVILLSIIPCSFGFVKYLTAKKKSELPPLKPESSIMWWKFVDKNTIYGYIFLIGSGVCLSQAIMFTKLDTQLQENLGKLFTGQGFCIMLVMIVAVIVILANMMSGVAALCVFLPFVQNMISETSTHFDKRHYCALAVGIGASLGFMWPFLYTPAYFAHFVGKVPKLKMAKVGLPSAIICAGILCASLCFFADVVLDNKLEKISMGAGGEETTLAPPA